MKRLLRILLAILLLLAAFHALPVIVERFAPAGYGAIDFLQYWAGSKLFIEGGNPYDQTAISAVEAAGKGALDVALPVILWNPPFVFPFIFFTGYLEFPFAVGVWALISILILAFCIRLEYLGAEHASNRGRILTIVFVLTFYPVPLSLAYGQLSPLLLLGLSSFFFIMRSGTSESGILESAWAGALLSFTLVKPHLLYLVYLYLLVLSLREKRYGLLTGFVCAAFVLGVLPLCRNPRIFEFYFQSMLHPPIYWKTPNLGSFFQELSGIHKPYIRMLPTLLCALLGFLWFLRLSKAELVHLFMLVPLSLLSSPYGWVYDQILLLPVACFCIARACGRGALGAYQLVPVLLLVSANVAMLLVPGEDMSNFVWYPVPFAAALWIVLHREDRSSV